MSLKINWSRALSRTTWITALTIFIVDQLTKIWIVYTVPRGTQIPILSFFNIVHTKNKGAAFGVFSESSPFFRLIFFGAVSIACLYFIIYWLSETPANEKWQRWALSLILGGALGNLLDRTLFGEVTDFLDVFVGTYHWPAFNVADSGISVGVCMLLIPYLRFFSKKA